MERPRRAGRSRQRIIEDVTDWTDPITYAAIVGAITGILGSTIALFQLCQSSREASQRREQESRQLLVDIARPTWTENQNLGIMLVELYLKISNPATIENSIVEAALIGDDFQLYTALPVARPRDGVPYVMHNIRVKSDALGLPLNVRARRGEGGSFYFAVPKEDWNLRRIARFWFKDLAGREYHERVLPVRRPQ